MQLISGPDLAELAADWIADRARRGGPFRIALSGGSTPRKVFERLAGADLDWSQWHVWWGDERQVPSDHPDSNERMAREALLSKVPVPEEQIHPLRALDTPLPDRFDLVLLGIGSDGHTASLFPGDPGLDATAPIVAVTRPDHPRLSLTYPVINGARTAAFIVGGADKAPILARVLAGDPELPASHVSADEVVVLADDAAAAGLG